MMTNAIGQTITAKLQIDGVPSTLTYRLLSKTTGSGTVEYGVRIELTGAITETAEIGSVTCSEGEILMLMASMAAGRVTPVALNDIVDDFLAQS